MTTQKQLAAVQKKLTAIKLKVDNLIEAVEKSEKATVAKASKAKAVKATPVKKAPKAQPVKKAKPAKKAAKASVKEKAGKVSATDLVLNFINGSKNGVDTATLVKETGFDQKKVRNIVFRTMKQGKITRLEKGIYVGVK